MNLFENDILNISAIFSVSKYVAKNPKDIIKYNSSLKSYELIFFVEGSSNTHFCGVDMIDAPNSVRYMPKDISDGEYTVKNIKPGYCIDIYFNTYDEMPDMAIGYENMDFLKDKFLKIYNIWTERKPDYYTHAMTVFYDIIRTIKNHNRKYTTLSHQKALNKALEYINANYTSPYFNYEELYKTTGYGSSYFHELFASVYNTTPVKFVTSKKIDFAKELLITNHYTVSEIAEMCGFENVYYFSTVFKKYVGVSPSNYKPF